MEGFAFEGEGIATRNGSVVLNTDWFHFLLLNEWLSTANAEQEGIALPNPNDIRNDNVYIPIP